MPLNLASPGVVIREVDLTVGSVQPSSNRVGGIVAPFAKGPVDSPVLVENENDLLKTFGGPYSTDNHYEHWLTASSYLSYGGSIRVIRADDADIKNSFVGSATSIKIKSLDHYEELGYNENTITGVTFAAKNPGSWGNGIKVAIIDAKADQILSGVSTAGIGTVISVGYGVTQSLNGKSDSLTGTSLTLDGYYLKGIITEINDTQVSVKVLSRVSPTGEEVNVDYQPDGVYSFTQSGSISLVNNSSASVGTTSYNSRLDWFDNQSITLNSSTIAWNTLVPRPDTSAYAAARGSRFDEIHVVVIDDLGTVSGNAGTILEKHINLSKAVDAEFSAGSTAYWRKYIAFGSQNIFAGSQPVGVTTVGFKPNTFELATNNGWDKRAENVIFDAAGSNTYTLSGGVNYGGTTSLTANGSLVATLEEIKDGYDIFGNTENVSVDFLLMGSAGYSKEIAQSLANKVIAVAEQRKDAIAFISPYRGAAITDTLLDTATTINSPEDTTNNVLSFYSSVASSSYAVFDSGYKYMYDRFSDAFRYVPLNGDIAGLCARNDVNNFPWYSPAGTTRGGILNAIKLAYTPNKSQRDRLYSSRINPVIFSPGAGIILFGDKTGLAKSSAFDRINVRRLFIYLENAISRAARDILFEFNDEITRTNFVNTVEPFLRDVQAKRGIFDYVLIADESNNTAAVIDANEFRADIYVKPARTINFIGLTFIATKTGIAFEEVIGNF